MTNKKTLHPLMCTHQHHSAIPKYAQHLQMQQVQAPNDQDMQVLSIY